MDSVSRACRHLCPSQRGWWEERGLKEDPESRTKKDVRYFQHVPWGTAFHSAYQSSATRLAWEDKECQSAPRVMGLGSAALPTTNIAVPGIMATQMGCWVSPCFCQTFRHPNIPVWHFEGKGMWQSCVCLCTCICFAHDVLCECWFAVHLILADLHFPLMFCACL